MKRLVALVVAVGLVVGAVLVRRAIDGDSSSSSTTTGGSTTTRGAATGITICATDLGRICDQLGGSITKENPGDTLARLVKTGSLGADAWLTTAPWADLAAYKAPGALDKAPAALASTPLRFFVTNAGADTVAAACPTIEWRCLAARDTVKVAFDDPTKTTAGLLTIVQQAAALFGSTDFGTNNFAQFELDLGKLKRNSPIKASTSAFTDNGLQNFAAASAVTALDAVGAALAVTAQFAGKTTRAAAVPAIAADVVMVTATGQRAPLKPDDVTQKLVASGYVAGPGGATRLPAADVLEQLQLLWVRLT